MATDLTKPLHRFLSDLHRRAVVARVAEHAALGALAGAAVGLLLVGVFWWREEPTLRAAVAATFAGALGGLAWGVARRPSRLAAAMIADRQWDLDDLLGSAAGVLAAERTGPTVADSSADWAAAVLASAAAACRNRSPAGVRVAKLGPRAGAGIGLAVALTFTLAVLADPPAGPSTPAGIAAAEADPVPAVRPPTGRPLVVLAADAKLRPAGPAGPVEERTRPGGLTEADAPAKVDPNAQIRPSDPAREAAGHPEADVGGGSGGGGPGLGKTSPARSPADPTPPSPAVDDPATPPAAIPPGRASVARGDGGLSSPVPSSPADGSGDGSRRAGAAGTAAAAPPVRSSPVPPWQAQTWAQDVRAARERLDAGRVPPAYRDLVRKYFEER